MNYILSDAAFALDQPIIYFLYLLLLAFVVAESVYYLVKSIKRAKKINMDMSKIKRAIATSVSFSILPALGIAIGVVTLVGALGIAFPAIRLSVIGSLQYETQMAAGTAEALTGSPNGLTALINNGLTSKAFVTIASVMTISIMSGPLFVLFGYKRFQSKMAKLGNLKGSADGKTNLGDLAFQVVFIGMVIGYLGMSIASWVGEPTSIASYYNFIAVVVAAVCMYIFEILVNKLGWKWLDSFSTSFAMLIAMAVVAVISYFVTKNDSVAQMVAKCVTDSTAFCLV